MATATGQLAPAATAARCPAVYRRRNPRATPLYQLLDAHFDTLKAQWDDRFEQRYGFWKGFYDTAVASYLDCGILENGFARVRCPQCANEFLVAFSCKGRGLCPSCGAKRAALFSALLQDRLLDDVPHAQWVLSIPKMLRPYFLHHRELLAELARISYDTVREMMAAAVDEPHARPGMIAVIQTFGSSLRWNPHIHAVVSRGVWDSGARWHPIPYVDPHKAELLFRHKVFRLLLDRELISQERIDLLLSWQHSGFSVHNRTTVYPTDTEGIHKLACYLMRPPVNLSRLRYHPDSDPYTYVPTWAGFLYLAVVLDAFSRRIVGWAMANHLRTELVLDALNMALFERKPSGVIHHSDQGTQYTSIGFGKRCEQAGVRPSMGSVGDCYDNAMYESFFATLECELIDRQSFRSHAEARMAIFDFIEGWYNPWRRHSGIGYCSPLEFERRYHQAA